MNVTEAVHKRASVRQFLDVPVPDETIRHLLISAARAPSGGNVQPWKIYVVAGESMDRFRNHIADQPLEKAEYAVYPEKLWEPHRTARFELGEQMYAKLGIARDDKPARYAQLAKNYTLFDAPSAIFCFVDRRMGPPQWSDLGMFLQTFMLLATEAGLDTCAQEAWANRAGSVAEFVGAPADQMLFCGVALGHRDDDAAVNSVQSDRLDPSLWLTWVD